MLDTLSRNITPCIKKQEMAKKDCGGEKEEVRIRFKIL